MISQTSLILMFQESVPFLLLLLSPTGVRASFLAECALKVN